MKIVLVIFTLLKRKIFLTLLLAAITLNSLAQIDKGQWLIGGDAAFSHYKYYLEKTSTLSLSPAVGYFFMNRLAGGLRFGYDAQFNTFQSIDKSRETFTSVVPFIRYYFLNNEQKINLFADAGYGYSWRKFKDLNPPHYSETWHSNIASFKAGPALFLNQHTSLEFTIGYDHSIKGGLTDTLAVNSLQVGVGLQIHIGKQKD